MRGRLLKALRDSLIVGALVATGLLLIDYAQGKTPTWSEILTPVLMFVVVQFVVFLVVKRNGTNTRAHGETSLDHSRVG